MYVVGTGARPIQPEVVSEMRWTPAIEPLMVEKNLSATWNKNMKPETKFRNYTVIPFLENLKRCKVFSVQQLALVGDPDLVICLNSFFVALEIKASGEAPRPIQEFKLSEVRKSGGAALAVSPDNWEDVKIILTTIEQRRHKWIRK